MVHSHKINVISYLQPEADKSNEILLAIGIVVVLLQIAGGIAGTVALYVGILIAARIVLTLDLKNYHVLLLLFLPTIALRNVNATLSIEQGMRINQYGKFSWYAIPFNSLVSTHNISFFDVSLPLVISMLATTVVFEHTFYKLKFLPYFYPKNLSVFWLMSIPISIYGAFLSIQSGYENFSTGFRILLSTGGFFWGLIAISFYKGNLNKLSNKIYSSVIIAISLFALGFVHNQLFLILPAFVGSLFILFIFKSYLKSIFFMAVGFIFLTRFTFTTSIGFLVGVLITLSIICFPHDAKKFLQKSKKKIITAVVGFPIIVFCLYNFIDVKYDANNNVIQLLLEKIFHDRYNVWLGVMNLVSAPPYIFVPSDRLITIKHYAREYFLEVSFGAHNYYLESLRQLGWLAGLIPISIAIYCILENIKVISFAREYQTIAILAGLLSATIVGTMTAHYLSTERIGFFFWSLNGILIGLAHRKHLLRIQINKIASESKLNKKN